ncbi:MAG: BatD family protein, partial [Planctomycetes bacterium]|nr:BatD family protein [Planctomycetota bacterium]
PISPWTRTGDMAALVLSFAFVLAAPSAGTELRLTLDRPWAYEDEGARAQIQVISPERGMTLPQIDPVQGLEIGRLQSPSQNISVVNGVRTVRLIYSCEIRPAASGRFTIGPARSTLPGGGAIESNTAELAVGKRPETGVRFRCEIGQPGGPVGYPFRVTYTILFSGEILTRSDFGFGLSLMSERDSGIRKLAVPLLDRKDLYVRIPGDSEDARKGQKQISLERGAVFEEGLVWKTYSFRYDVTPMAAGPIEMGNATVSMALVTGQQRVRTVFGVETQPAGREFPAETGSVIYQVEDLPADGKPAAFSGAVGRFTIEASATPTEVDAFAPIDLELRIRGDGLLEALKPPVWDEMPDLVADFQIASDVDAGKIEGDALVFHKQIRARGPDVTRIPAIAYPYYDPKGKRYETAWTDPIPIRVRAVETAKAEDAVTSAREERPAAVAKPSGPPIQGRFGVGANYGSFGRPVPGVRAAARLFDPVFLLALIAPPAAFAGMLLLRRMRRRDPRRIRIRAAAGRARAALSAPGLAPEAIARAYQDYFRDRLDLGAGEITPEDLGRTLRGCGAGETEAKAAIETLERVLAATFGAGAASDASALARAVRDAIEEVERCLR